MKCASLVAFALFSACFPGPLPQDSDATETTATQPDSSAADTAVGDSSTAVEPDSSATEDVDDTTTPTDSVQPTETDSAPTDTSPDTELPDDTTPQIRNEPAIEASEGVLFTFTPDCRDDDGDATIVGLADSDECGGEVVEGTYEWRPTELQGGSICHIALRCSDGNQASTFSREVSVHEVNELPVFSNLPASVQARWGRAGSFVPDVTDADVPPQSLTTSIGTNTCTFPVTIATGAVLFTCGPSTEACSAEVIANDTKGSTTKTLDITCTNEHPTFSSTPTTSGSEQAEYTYTPICSDLDGDSVVLGVSLEDTCGGVISQGVYRSVLGETPGVGGTCQLSVTCSDSVAVETQTRTITVGEQQSAPSFANLPSSLELSWKTPGTFDVSATDTDLPADELTYQLESETCSFPVDVSAEGHVSFACTDEESCEAIIAVNDSSSERTATLSIHCKNKPPSFSGSIPDRVQRYEKYTAITDCVDAEDSTSVSVAADDTCGGKLRANVYWFVPNEGTPASCKSHVTCTDGAAIVHRQQDVTIDAGTWAVNGQLEVMAAQEARGVLYVGGNFDGFARPASDVLAIDVATTTVDEGWPRFDGGSVWAIRSDGNGGFYVGGNFTHVDGLPIANLAHVMPAGVVDPDFAPQPDDLVFAIEVVGDRIYVGGGFSHIAGASRVGLAAVDRHGVATSFDAHFVSAFVASLASDGGRLFVSGNLEVTAGQPFERLVALNVNTAASIWSGSSKVETYANVMSVAGGVLYYGGAGEVYDDGTEARVGLAAFDTATGAVTAWRFNVSDATISALSISDGVVYFGGVFQLTQGVFRFNAAAMTVGGLLTNWNPRPDGRVTGLVARGQDVYVVGDFQTIGARHTLKFARTRASDGLVQSGSDVPYTGEALVLAGDGQRILIGGRVAGYDWQRSSGLAGIHMLTGAPLPWYPYANGAVRGLAESNDELFVAGDFTLLSGQGRDHLASFMTATGLLSDWQPDTDFDIYAIAATHTKVYVGGSAFDEMDGQMHARLVAYDRATGALSSWAPAVAGSAVYTILASGGFVYVGGDFDSIDAQVRSGVAAFNDTTGQLLAWYSDPPSEGTVFALAFGSGALHVGGNFANIGDRAYSFVARLDPVTGYALGWHPNVEQPIYALAHGAGVTYAAFDNEMENGTQYVTAFDANGSELAWGPVFDSSVHSIVVVGETVFVGGSFQYVDGRLRGGLAASQAP